MKTTFVPINSLNTTSGPGAPYAIGITFFFAETAHHPFPGRVPSLVGSLM